MLCVPLLLLDCLHPGLGVWTHYSFLIAITAGLVLATLIFAVEYGRNPVIHDIKTGADVHTDVIRPTEQKLLQKIGACTDMLSVLSRWRPAFMLVVDCFSRVAGAVGAPQSHLSDLIPTFDVSVDVRARVCYYQVAACGWFSCKASSSSDPPTKSSTLSKCVLRDTRA